jgi:hypothetical protein
MSRALLQQALEELAQGLYHGDMSGYAVCMEEIRAELAKPQRQPDDREVEAERRTELHAANRGEPCKAIERQPMTGGKVQELCEQLSMEPYQVRAVELFHGIGKT